MKWGVTWKMVESNFGRLRGIMDPALSLMGYENSALVIDPRHIRVVEQVPMQERALDLQKAGIRNSHDVVLEESITLELTNPKAHGILTLA
jgi:galactokinase